MFDKSERDNIYFNVPYIEKKREIDRGGDVQWQI